MEANSISPQKTALSTNASDIWVSAYLASYNHYVEPTGNWGNLPTEEIDWEAFTHLFYFALKVNPDGSLSPIKPYQNVSPDRIKSIVSAAHNAGKPVIFTVGGWGSHDAFAAAIAPGVRSVFISNLVTVLKTWGFDGIDIDMEPINSGDTENYKAFIRELDTVLQSVSTPLSSSALLTAATSWKPGLFAELQNNFDQINLMTYDLSGAWPDWVSWHNAAVYNGGVTFPSNGKPVPSVDGKVNAFINAGVPRQKLGIGIDFYGYVWSGGSGTSTGGVTEPAQSWSSKPVVTDNVPYHEIMQKYYSQSAYRWDSKAQAAYLSIDEPGSSNDKFISYDDEETIKSKISYIRQKGIGGAIIWELSGGYQKDNPAGQRDNLLQAVKEAAGSSSTTPTADTTPPSVSISSPASGSTVSGTVEIQIDANDNLEVQNVSLTIDGISVANNLAPAPYAHTWNTTSHPDHTCIIEATATDVSGNQSATSSSVAVSNSSSPSDPVSSSGLAIFEDQLEASWINSSWNASVDFANIEKVFMGSRTIKIVQNAWGGLSLHYGNWGEGKNIEPGQYESLEFAFYVKGSSGASLKLQFQNDQGQSFPKFNYGWVNGDRWISVNIPMEKLNPNNQSVNRLSILETSGSSKTYFVDELRLIGSGSGSLSVPKLASPNNNETGVSADPVLSWSGSTGSYEVQIATDPSFANLVIEKSRVSSNTLVANNLSPHSTYYWRVKGTSTTGSSDWSQTWTFTTARATSADTKKVYQEGIESPWINSSWNASIDFSNSERPYAGSKSIKVIQKAWGGLSLHSGNWGSSVDVNTGQFDAIEFEVYTPDAGVSMALRLQNDNGNSFPRVSHGSIPANRWVTVSIPVTKLNPSGFSVHRINIVEMSGTTKTLYIDNIRFITNINL